MAARPSRPAGGRARDASPACWEFWDALARTGCRPGHGPTCAECPVPGQRAQVCHEIRPRLPGGTVRAPSCPDCVYFATVMGVESDDT